MRTVLIEGPLTEADLTDLAAVLRVIERRNPAATFSMIWSSSDGAGTEEIEAIRRIFPKLAGVPVNNFSGRLRD